MKMYKSPLPEIKLKYKTGEQKKIKIESSKEAHEIMRGFFDQDTLELTESFVALFLDRGNKTIGWVKLSQGGISGTVIDLRILFGTALKCAASSLIVAHNHPSGNLNYSKEDLKITKNIKEAGKLFEISLLDHLIITKNDYLSIASERRI